MTELNPSANSALMGLYLSNGIYTTQCEAEGFRRITYFYDRPDSLSVYTTRIEAVEREAPILLSNGNPVEAGAIEGTDRHYAIWHDPFPKPSYLFAVVGGALASIHDTFTTRSGKIVKLGIYCEHGKEERCRYALDALKRSMRWDEERFGLEYDLDVFNIVAVSDFNMGAMENKGLNIFNDKYVLVDPETGTDQDYAHVESVIAHEYFHNWTGNRITCANWFQLCLKEGLTVFRDQEFTADVRSRAVERISDVAGLRQHQFPEDAGPLAHPVRPTSYREINNFYTATVYEKGAEVCRMLQTVLGRRRLSRRHGSLLRTARRRRLDHRGFFDLLRRREPHRPVTIRALVSPGRHADDHRLASLRAGEGTADAGGETGSAGDAGPQAEAADAHSDRLRTGRPGRSGSEFFQGERRYSRRRRDPSYEEQSADRLRGRARAPDPVALSRVLRAGPCAIGPDA